MLNQSITLKVIIYILYVFYFDTGGILNTVVVVGTSLLILAIFIILGLGCR